MSLLSSITAKAKDIVKNADEKAFAYGFVLTIVAHFDTTYRVTTNFAKVVVHGFDAVKNAALAS
jgi:hypothetical protein